MNDKSITREERKWDKTINGKRNTNNLGWRHLLAQLFLIMGPNAFFLINNCILSSQMTVKRPVFSTPNTRWVSTFFYIVWLVDEKLHLHAINFIGWIFASITVCRILKSEVESLQFAILETEERSSWIREPIFRIQHFSYAIQDLAETNIKYKGIPKSNRS